MASNNLSFKDNPISVKHFGRLIDLIQDGTITGKKRIHIVLQGLYSCFITGKTGKQVIKLMIKDDRDPFEIVKEKNWIRITDKDTLQSICNELIKKHADKANAVKNGDTKLFHFFLGQAMGRTKGMADPNILNQVLSNAFGWNSFDELMAAGKAKSGNKK